MSANHQHYDLSWKNVYNLGLEEIDVQHKYFLHCLERLDHEVYHKSKPSKIPMLYDEIQRFLTIHFKFEESLMEIYEYSDSKKHRLEHEKFLENLTLLKPIQIDNDLELVEIVKKGMKWFIDHTTDEDIFLVRHINRIRKSQGT